MSTLPPNPSGSPSDDVSETLTNRVAARVSNARLALEGQTSTRRRGVRASTDTYSEAELREMASLKRVFRDLGTSYRRYRSQTGAPVVPELRAAAYHFRAEPSLTSLVAVAAFLDELDLLS
jgi:hypothetical protein